MSRYQVSIQEWNRIKKEYNNGCSYKKLSKRHDIKEDSIKRFIDTVNRNAEIRKTRLKKQKVWSYFQYIFKTKGHINKNWVKCTVCKLILKFKSAKEKMKAFGHHEKHRKLVNLINK